MFIVKILLLLQAMAISLTGTEGVNLNMNPVVQQMQRVDFQAILVQKDLMDWVGKSEDDLLSVFGRPVRKDASAYDYIWFVYTDHKNYVYQFGVEDNQIVTIYAISSGEKRESYDSLNEKYSFQTEVYYKQDQSEFTIRLSSDDLQKKPLVKIDDDLFIQFYFDTFTNQLFAYRILTGNTLLTQRPYEIEYRGELPEQPNLSSDDWREIEKGMEQQIFDITNVLRTQYEIATLKWDESAQQVAYLHSQDMAVNDYFSHTSLNGNGLKERLETEQVVYLNAAENIASGYIDAISAMEGWLNSPSHRDAMLSDRYTHLGVGVYQRYYTQNFIEKPL